MKAGGAFIARVHGGVTAQRPRRDTAIVLMDDEDMAMYMCEESQQKTKVAMINVTRRACFIGLDIVNTRYEAISIT